MTFCPGGLREADEENPFPAFSRRGDCGADGVVTKFKQNIRLALCAALGF
jgi:hypothetical protein